LYHHEREDGSGYLHKPGEDIPAAAKILAAADVYEALISSRPYRPAVSAEQALAYLESHKGSLFDPGVVDALGDILTTDASQPVRIAPSSM
jgi:two-component system response regulator RpfG